MRIVQLRKCRESLTCSAQVNRDAGPVQSITQQAWRFIIAYENWPIWLPHAENVVPIAIDTPISEIGRGSCFSLSSKRPNHIAEIRYWEDNRELRYEIRDSSNKEAYAVRLDYERSDDTLIIELRGEIEIGTAESILNPFLRRSKQNALDLQAKLLKQALCSVLH